MTRKIRLDEFNDSMDNQLTINQDFAKKYEEKNRKEELSRLMDKYGNDFASELNKSTRKRLNIEDNGSEEEEDSESDEEEDEEGELVTPEVDAQIMKTIAMIREKNPLVYDSTVQHFSEEQIQKAKQQFQEKKKQKPLHLKDYHRQNLLKQANGEASDEEKSAKTFAQEQEELKSGLTSLLHNAVDEEPDDFLTLRTKGKEEVEKEDEEYRNFLLESMASGVGDSVHKFKDLAVKNENSEDAFLWDYILNRGWVDKEAKRMPTYDEIIDEIEEDEEAVEEADEFERKHNFRFEEEGSAQVVTHSRNVDNSVRRVDNKRKEEREKRKERKELEKAQKIEELKRLKNLKKQEIKEQLRKIQEMAGIKTEEGDSMKIMGLDEVALEQVLEDEDFDPDAYDQKMKSAFGEEYYEMDDPHVKPVFNDDIDITDIVGVESDEEDKKKKKKKKKKKHDDSMEIDIEMDADYMEPEPKKSRVLSKIQPKQGKSMNDYLEEYYKLDYEDMIGDLPTRFKYVHVEQEDYGLNVQDILQGEDQDLNEYIGLKKLAPFRHADKLKKDKKKFKKDKKQKKRELLQKIYGKRKKDRTETVPAPVDISESRLKTYGLA